MYKEGDVVELVVPEVLIHSYDYKKHMLNLNPYALPTQAIIQDVKVDSIISIPASLFGFDPIVDLEKDGIIEDRDGIEYLMKFNSTELFWEYRSIKNRLPKLETLLAYTITPKEAETLKSWITSKTPLQTTQLKGVVFDYKGYHNPALVQTYQGYLYFIHPRFLKIS